MKLNLVNNVFIINIHQSTTFLVLNALTFQSDSRLNSDETGLNINKLSIKAIDDTPLSDYKNQWNEKRSIVKRTQTIPLMVEAKQFLNMIKSIQTHKNIVNKFN